MPTGKKREAVELRFQVLCGCQWLDVGGPEGVLKGNVFRALRPDGEPHLFAFDVVGEADAGVYVSTQAGSSDGVPFLVVPEKFEMMSARMAVVEG